MFIISEISKTVFAFRKKVIRSQCYQVDTMIYYFTHMLSDVTCEILSTTFINVTSMEKVELESGGGAP